uniref:NADH dehydrogenase n=1 Tax=Acartia pacifica TaxID=335913 RepID=A0A0U2TJT6_ACAPC|nr:NADH dehydrogenase [Acartia pacifica]ALS04442.1 NADH dehydrogenase [Acartia pacifica]ALS04443.1 NADH dehydrogenase [Acartia pacifica]ALS04444.1 NADH dehydrogenase [Acartia pacifica]
MFISRIVRSIDHPYMYGPGGRFANNRRMQGLTWQSFKHHKALQPLFAVIGTGCVGVLAYLVRLAVKTTDVNWVKNKDPAYPYNYYDGKQFKLLNPAGVDYSQYGKERPRFE